MSFLGEVPQGGAGPCGPCFCCVGSMSILGVELLHARTNGRQHAAALENGIRWWVFCSMAQRPIFLFVCGIEPRTDATLLGCLFLCAVFFHSFTFIVSVYFLPCQVLRTNLKRDTRKLLGPRRTVCNGQFLKALASICDSIMRKIRKMLGNCDCILCAIWLSSKSAFLKDHVVGENVKQPDGSRVRKLGGHASKVACSVPAMEPPPQLVPTIVVNVTTPEKAPEVDCCSLPLNKKHASSASVLGSILQKRLEQQHFHLDLTRAFMSCNIPLKLAC